MLHIEKISGFLRHAPGLRRLNRFWDWVRPRYNRMLHRVTAHSGLPRHLNGTDLILLDPYFRAQPESYEPELWKCIMDEVAPGTVVIDVGANIGLYAVTIAKRMGTAGRVIAVEPDPVNAGYLRKHLAMNNVEARVDVIEAAVSAESGTAMLHVQEYESRITTSKEADAETTVQVTMKTLDEIVPDGKVDLILIDVEGFEEGVLRGGTRLLKDPERRPKSIFIEVHPFAWTDAGSSSESILEFLTACDYRLTTLDGEALDPIVDYGHVVARPARGLTRFRQRLPATLPFLIFSVQP